MSLTATHRRRESFLSQPWAKWKKKGHNELYLCIPTTVEQYLCVWRRKNKLITMEQ